MDSHKQVLTLHNVYTGEVFSTVEDTISTAGDTMMSVGDIMFTLGDIMSPQGVFSTLENIMSASGGYHDKCRGRSLGKHLNLYGNISVLMISTHSSCYPPVYSWYLPVY